MSDKPHTTTAVQPTGDMVPVGDTESTASLVLHHRDGAKVVTLVQGRSVVVGRAHPADTVVRDINVSRQHARFTWDEHGVYVEDLGSTNGTKVNGERIEGARRITSGDEVTFGSITASVHVLQDRSLHSIDGHDRFVARLEEEVLRARTFARPLALLMIRAIGRERTHVRHWLADVRARLRPVDAVGAYGRATLLVALPEQDASTATGLAHTLVTSRTAEPRLVAGVADVPRSAATAQEAIAVARVCARAATLDRPVHVAEGSLGPGRSVVMRDQAMQRLFETVDRVARSHVPVLILGETGTGKEVVARRIHDHSARRDGPMRSINCGAIPDTLLESTLFGHEKGSFTGAERRAAGIFEQAHGGTVFLDEVGELPPQAQAALLRVLETKKVTRVGSTEETPVDVRVVAATHRDLEAMCNEGGFRWDLFFRLNTMTLAIPALRERQEDIEPLVRLFLAEASRESGVPVRGIDAEALEMLATYAWPGNVRELRNVIERAVVVAEGETITVEDLSDRVRGARPTSIAPAEPEHEPSDVDFKDRIKSYETRLIVDALRKTGGNQTEAARLLRMPLRTLVHKIRTYGIKKKFEV